jgi:protein-L-isoaspartate(D-aspartate) O-methyltransferase
MTPARTDHEGARERMVERQIAGRGIRDEGVLAAMRRVPREEFVRPGDRSQAYSDRAMPIGHGQTISQPFIVALMTEKLHLTGRERVLEVGTGSGYQTAVLAELADEVFTVERVPELSERAQRTLGWLGYGNVSYRVGDGSLGWPGEAPFDRILVTAGAPHRPETLLEQLGSDGRLIAPVGSRHHQVLTAYWRDRSGEIRERALGDCVFVQLIGEEGW